ncbi:MAG: prohead protease/major capsid protein fusion protein [Reyranellaceae bacterium]
MKKLKQLRQQLTRALADMESHKEAGGEAFDAAKEEAERLRGLIADAEAALEVEPGPGSEPQPAAQPQDRDAARAAERERVMGIADLCRTHKVEDKDAVAWQRDPNMTVDQVRAKILEGLAAQSDASQERSQIRVTRDAGDTLREAVEEALLHRYRPGEHKLTDKGRGFGGMRLMEVARCFLDDSGVKTRGLSPMELAGVALGLERSGGMLGTSDFPYLLANVANKTLRMAYESAPQTFRRFARQATAMDFKQISRVQLSGAPSFEKVNESGEFKRGSLTEGREVYQLATYGKVVAISRQTLINDDLDAFTRLPALFGAAAADFESDTVIAVLTANANMGDGNPLFDSGTHGNVGTAGDISVTTLSEARKLMRKQTGLEGRVMNLNPKFLLVPAAQETLAEQYTSANYQAAVSGNINSFAGKLEPLVEPRLDGTSADVFYLIADPARIDTIEYAYLAGQEGVRMASRVGFDVDGMELKAALDFAAKAIDWRGMVQMPG